MENVWICMSWAAVLFIDSENSIEFHQTHYSTVNRRFIETKNHHNQYRVYYNDYKSFRYFLGITTQLKVFIFFLLFSNSTYRTT